MTQFKTGQFIRNRNDNCIYTVCSIQLTLYTYLR